MTVYTVLFGQAFLASGCAPYVTHFDHLQATIFWQRIRQLQEEDVIVNVIVDSANKGGMLVKYGVYDGFIPVSQIGSVSKHSSPSQPAVMVHRPNSKHAASSLYKGAHTLHFVSKRQHAWACMHRHGLCRSVMCI